MAAWHQPLIFLHTPLLLSRCIHLFLTNSSFTTSHSSLMCSLESAQYSLIHILSTSIADFQISSKLLFLLLANFWASSMNNVSSHKKLSLGCRKTLLGVGLKNHCLPIVLHHFLQNRPGYYLCLSPQKFLLRLVCTYWSSHKLETILGPIVVCWLCSVESQCTSEWLLSCLEFFTSLVCSTKLENFVEMFSLPCFMN